MTSAEELALVNQLRLTIIQTVRQDLLNHLPKDFCSPRFPHYSETDSMAKKPAKKQSKAAKKPAKKTAAKSAAKSKSAKKTPAKKRGPSPLKGRSRKPADAKDSLTIPEVAAKEKVSNKAVYDWIRQGKVKATKHPTGIWLIKKAGYKRPTPQYKVKWKVRKAG